jgi:transglutaminase-like putative cysteine protease
VTADVASARLQIRHVTGFTYEGATRASYNEVRMTPPTLAHQTMINARISTTPNAVQATYRDYFGTIVTTFDLHEPHDRLVVTAEATVDTYRAAPLPPSWSAARYRDDDVVDQFAEFLVPTPRSSLATEVVDEARERFAGLDAHSAALAVTDWVRHHVRYVPGSTNVTSTAAEVWELGQGVCQDMTHVTSGVLRAIGIPARYVSGYLQPDLDAGAGATSVGQSHAWVEYFSGEWTPIDPTNGGRVGVHHVLVAVGREYGDVPPLKGIYHGEPSRALGVEVVITQLT